MKKILKEAVLWILIALPYAYLALIWNKLPDQVPTHFNLAGEPNDWSSKTSLLFIPAGMGIFIYILMRVIPVLDPKKKIRQMGEKFYSLRLIVTFFFSVIAIYILHSTHEGNLKSPNILITILGVMFAVLGNYFPTIRPNYFIGLRTPWTLENEMVWKKTHQLGGMLWMIGGALIVIMAFIVKDNAVLAISFASIIFVMVIVPVVFSYIEFKKEMNDHATSDKV